jgi:hypothetical protein
MTEEMSILQDRFNEVRNLVEACAPPERVVPKLEDLRISVLWQIGILSCWKPIVRGDYGQQTASFD